MTSDVNLTIYNMLGQKVKVFTFDHQSPGRYEVFWDGTDASETPVAAGVYLYRLKAAEKIATRKMVLLK